MIEKLKLKGYTIKQTDQGFVVKKGYFTKIGKATTLLAAQAIALNHYLSCTKRNKRK